MSGRQGSVEILYPNSGSARHGSEVELAWIIRATAAATATGLPVLLFLRSPGHGDHAWNSFFAPGTLVMVSPECTERPGNFLLMSCVAGGQKLGAGRAATPGSSTSLLATAAIVLRPCLVVEGYWKRWWNGGGVKSNLHPQTSLFLQPTWINHPSKE